MIRAVLSLIYGCEIPVAIAVLEPATAIVVLK